MRDAAARSILNSASIEGAWHLPGSEEAYLVEADPRWPVPFVVVMDGRGNRCGIFLPGRDDVTLHCLPDRKGVRHAHRVYETGALQAAFPSLRGGRLVEADDHDGRRWGAAAVRAEAARRVIEDVCEAREPSVTSFVDDEIEWMLSGDTIGDGFASLPRAKQRSLTYLCDWLARTARIVEHARGREREGTTGVVDVCHAMSVVGDTVLDEVAVAEALGYFDVDCLDGEVRCDGAALDRLDWMANFATSEEKLLRL